MPLSEIEKNSFFSIWQSSSLKLWNSFAWWLWLVVSLSSDDLIIRFSKSESISLWKTLTSVTFFFNRGQKSIFYNKTVDKTVDNFCILWINSFVLVLFQERKNLDMDFTSLTTALTTSAFSDMIEPVLPIVGVAILVGFLFYVIRWAIGLFRGI